jgi:site-specific recombinase XerD
MNLLIGTVLERYLQECQRVNKGLKTIRAYQDTLHDFVRFLGDIQAADLTEEHVQRYITDVGARQGKNGHMSVQSVHKYYSVVRTFVRWMYAHNFIPRDVTDRIEFSQPSLARPDALTEEELQRLQNHLDERGDYRDKVIFEVLLDTGLRVHELTGLNLDDVDLDARTLRVSGQNGHHDNVSFGSEVQGDLSSYIQDHRRCDLAENALFINRFGSRLEPEGLNILIKRTLQKIRDGGKCGSETLRNTFACSFLRNEGSLLALHTRLRNADFRSTERYLVMFSDDQ